MALTAEQRKLQESKTQFLRQVRQGRKAIADHMFALEELLKEIAAAKVSWPEQQSATYPIVEVAAEDWNEWQRRIAALLAVGE